MNKTKEKKYWAPITEGEGDFFPKTRAVMRWKVAIAVSCIGLLAIAWFYGLNADNWLIPTVLLLGVVFVVASIAKLRRIEKST